MPNPKIYILGNKGNMGRRYTAICKYLGYEVDGHDKDDDRDEEDAHDSTHFIIATPTDTHLLAIEEFTHCRETRPLLIEKPLINNVSDFPRLEELVNKARNHGLKLSMVSQYDEIVDQYLSVRSPYDSTQYDYYHSGPDGLAWDCINIIWHAEGKIELKQESPVWRCQVNGQPLDLERMQYCYIEMIEKWISQPYIPQYDTIIAKHQKVLDYLDGKFD